MSKLKRILILASLGIVCILSLSASSAVATTPVTTDTVAVQPDATVEGGDDLLTYLPAGGIITIVLSGILMITKAINEGRTIQVSHYKDRAAIASTEAAGDMKKLRDQMNTMEAKLDEVLADRDELRETLENRKVQYSKELLEMEARHQVQLLETHAVMLQQLNIRHKLERILTENHIEFPTMSPPPSKEPPTPVH